MVPWSHPPHRRHRRAAQGQFRDRLRGQAGRSRCRDAHPHLRRRDRGASPGPGEGGPRGPRLGERRAGAPDHRGQAPCRVPLVLADRRHHLRRRREARRGRHRLPRQAAGARRLQHAGGDPRRPEPRGDHPRAGRGRALLHRRRGGPRRRR